MHHPRSGRPVLVGIESLDHVQQLVRTAGDLDNLGAARQGALHRKLARSVPWRVVDRTDRTVFLAQNGDVVGGPLYGLGRLLRR